MRHRFGIRGKVAVQDSPTIPKRLIPAMPTRLPFRIRARNAVAALPFPDRPAIQTYSGRVAIYQGLLALGLGKGDTVLVPAYACGSEIDAVLKAGLDIRFYPVDNKLRPDMEVCNDILAQTPFAKALFVTHYFGFAQPIKALREFADKNNLLLIEDCAHGFLSCDANGTPLGTSGDIGVFSYMKGLPLTDGGACVFNRSDIGATQDTLRQANIRKLAGRFLFQVERSLETVAPWAARIFDKGVRSPLRALKNIGKRQAVKSHVVGESAGREEMGILGLDLEQADWAISKIARATLSRLDLTHVRDIRRRNYELLLPVVNALDNVCALFPELPNGTCPLFFPIEIDDAAKVQRELAEQGLGTKYFWSYFHDRFPRDEFPFEAALKTRVLVLPVHQDLTAQDMAKVGEILTRVMQGRAVG